MVIILYLKLPLKSILCGSGLLMFDVFKEVKARSSRKIKNRHMELKWEKSRASLYKSWFNFGRKWKQFFFLTVFCFFWLFGGGGFLAIWTSLVIVQKKFVCHFHFFSFVVLVFLISHTCQVTWVAPGLGWTILGSSGVAHGISMGPCDGVGDCANMLGPQSLPLPPCSPYSYVNTRIPLRFCRERLEVWSRIRVSCSWGADSSRTVAILHSVKRKSDLVTAWDRAFQDAACRSSGLFGLCLQSPGRCWQPTSLLCSPLPPHLLPVSSTLSLSPLLRKWPLSC